MADKEISALTAAATLDGTELAIISQGGNSRKLTLSGLSAISQPLDTDLTAIAALTSAANKGLQSTGAGTWALYDLTAAGLALLDDADPAAQRATLGLGTAAVVATGTSGATIPLLNGTNTWGAAQTFSTIKCNYYQDGSGNTRFNVSAGDVNDAGGYALNTTVAYRVSGTKVVGAQGAAVADATDAGSVIAQLNLLLARCRTHGLIAT